MSQEFTQCQPQFHSISKCLTVHLYVFLLYIMVPIKQLLHSGNEHSVAELVALPICGRAETLKEAFLLCIVGSRGKKNVFFQLPLVH